jgi:very-short-patch-repair endonuclease
MLADQERTRFLETAGYRVVRFWDNDVLSQMDAILEEIVRILNNPHPSLSLKGRGLNTIKSSKEL